MRKILLLLVCVAGMISAKSQSCVPTTINGTVLNLACGQPCTSFSYQVPHLRSTNDYLLANTPYTPLPYLVAGGSEDPNLYNDDTYSTLINLPFQFCFYGANYNTVVVGSNGLITFDATNQSCANAYTISPTIPFSGGTQCSQFSTYYPKATIMAAYSDLDPRTDPPNGTNASPADRKIQWRVEGTAPCRKFVVSYYHIGVFGDQDPGSCGYDTPSTFQIVIYESTGLIDIYFQNKSCTSSTNSGKGILGIQDFNRTTALAAPGKNATFWTASNEGYRFTPNGGTSNYLSAELYTMGGTLVATGDTSTTTAGILDINFPNFCPPPGPTTQYVVKTTFNSCTGSPLVSLDTITVNRVTILPATISVNPTTCGVSVGSITVTPTAGTPPYTYTLNAGAPQTAPGPYTFSNLAAGPYTVVVADVTGCSKTFNVTVNTTTTIPGTISSTPISCPLATDGTITVTPTGGTAPFSFSLDGGPGQPSGLFTNVAAGPHTVIFTDAFGCIGTLSITVGAPTAITNTLTKTDVSCNGGNTGTITATYSGGTPPYQIQVDGGAYAPATGSPQLIPGLGTGLHTVCIKDNNNCIKCSSITIGQSPPVTLSLTETDVLCNGGSTGKVTATFGGGVPPYFYKIDGGTYSPTGSSPQIFTGLAAGSHTVCIKDNLNCEQCASIIVNEPPPLSNPLTKTDVLCNGGNTGTITTNFSGGVPPYYVSVDGGVLIPAISLPQTLTGFTAGTHTICLFDANSCQLCTSITINEPPALINTLTKTDVLCKGGSTGTITTTYSGGTAPYFVQVNGGTYAPATGSPQTLTGLAAGSYTVCIKDNNGCILCKTIIITEPNLLTASAVATNGTCASNDGRITITAAGGTPAYQYSINNGVTYQAANIFNGLGVGNYNIKVKDANGCTASTTTTIILDDTMRLELGPDTTICIGKSVTMQPQTNAATDTFKWTPATWLDYDTAKNAIATPQSTIKYYLTAKWGVCQRKDSIIVNILKKPIAFAGNDTTICYKTNATLHGTAFNLSGTVNYSWAPPDSLNTPNAATTIARMDTTRQFTLTVTDNYGCGFSVSDSMWVFMQPVVPAFAGNDTIAMAHKPHQLHATGGFSYLWSPAGPLNNPFIQDPLAVLSNDTYFTVLVTDAIGCSAEDGVFIKVYEGPNYLVPNAFSPNKDGLNEVFRPVPPGMRSTEYFRVFNRVGQMVFQTNKWMEGWDGKFKGKDADQGTYVWMIRGRDVNGKLIEMQGTVTLLR